ncbi:MAG: hypothetical protein ACE365_00075 [Gammaproteobacteria bacterium]
MKNISAKSLVASILFSISLTGCLGHHNPLMETNEKAAAVFLFSASQYAEKQLGIFVEPGGKVYGYCMRGKAAQSECTRLYKSMAQYSKTTIDFKSITINDLKSRKSWARLMGFYDEETFNAI